jgi:hypothetical protein
VLLDTRFHVRETWIGGASEQPPTRHR